MKIYISLPITGHDINNARRRAEAHAKSIRKLGHTPISPFDIAPEPDRPYSYYMGKDIAGLIECDAILLLSGWSESRGCHLEWRCAEIYRKKIFHHIKEISQI